ncbi:aldehyde dehydrogenase family protein [Streptomyces sp. NPDC059894]|uniref:aldehyde dehydrogenase family protein n=1 Tax=unclassified Streptomyces TaxID=2593676 RepID=UPI00365F2E68
MIPHYVGGRWYTPDDKGRAHHDATTGCEIFRVSTARTDLTAALRHARSVGSPAVRSLSRQRRARQLRELVRLLGRDRALLGELSELSGALGATPADAAADIDGGVLTVRHHAAAVTGLLPDADAAEDKVLVHGEAAEVARGAGVVSGLTTVDRPGVALHINGFSLPVSTVLEQFALSYLAGLPSVVRPAGRTAALVTRLVESVVAAGVLPEGALQTVSGPVALPDCFTAQDLVSFTGTRATAARLRARLLRLTVEPRCHFAAEPLTCAVLGPDAAPDDPAFHRFVDRLVAGLTAHAGQSAAAVRRAFVPAGLLDRVAQATAAALADVTVGPPAAPGVRMGPLVDPAHRDTVRRAVRELSGAAATVTGSADRAEVTGGDPRTGAFMAPVLLAARPDADPRPLHTVEAFGPVGTLIPYRTADEIAAGLSLGRGGLRGWLVTGDPAAARTLVHAIAPWHERVEVVEPAARPTPRTGPGAAECLRRLRAQQAAVVLESSPTVSGAVTNRWVHGGARVIHDTHLLGRHLDDLRVGDALVTGRRTVTRADIDRFTRLTGDRFYAHADEAAAARNPVLRGIVAHGSLVIGLATGLFVTEGPGPVLANQGLENLVFLAPVRPGDELTVTLTAKEITPRPGTDHGEVRWEVEVANQDGLPVTRYDLLALTAKRASDAPITKENAC